MTMPAPVPTIDVTEAERRRREDPARPVIVDVREPVEFAEVRAPDVLHIPMSTFAGRVGDLPTDRPLLLICHVGGRSAAAAGFLIRAGRTDVTNVAGGMDAWERPGCPSGAGRWPRRGRPRGLTRVRRPASPAAGAGSLPAEDLGDQLPRPGGMGVGPADQDQDDEVEGPGAGRVQVAELLADLALDGEPGHRRADEAEPEERGLRGDVRADAGLHHARIGRAADDDRVGPETTGAPPWAGTGRSLTARCFHSAIVPSLDGVAQ